jgi:hypothetical protein
MLSVVGKATQKLAIAIVGAPLAGALDAIAFQGGHKGRPYNSNRFSRRLRARVFLWRLAKKFSFAISSPLANLLSEHDLRQTWPAVAPAFITIMPGT